MVTGEDLRRLCVFEGSVPPHPFLRRPEQRLFDLLYFMILMWSCALCLQVEKYQRLWRPTGQAFTWSRMNMNRNLVTHVCLGFFSPGVDLREAGARDAILKCWDLGVLKVKTIPWFIIICPECFQVLLCCRTVYSCTCSWWCLHEATTWKCAPLMCRCKSLVLLLTSIMCILMTSHIWNAYFNCQLSKKGPPNHQMHTQLT